MSLMDLCDKYFGSRNFYKILNIQKEASEKEVHKAYFKLALSCHPVRVDENNKIHATEKFKILGKVHSVLSDKEKRSIYDVSVTPQTPRSTSPTSPSSAANVFFCGDGCV